MAACLGVALSVAADNIAPQGSAILGVKSAVDTTPGISLYQSGMLVNINDMDPSSRVDNWSGGSDGGRGVSYVGIIWPVMRYEQFTSLSLTLAAFGDGGWFGPNGASPGVGGNLGTADLTEPTIQYSTDGGATWQAVGATSDYLTVMTGAPIGGGANPNPMPYTVTFTLSPPLTDINGLRIIGPNGGAGSDANGFLGVFELAVEAALGDSDADGMPDDWERAHGLSVGTNDGAADPDGDGLSNIGEYTASTDPKNADSDGDGYSDGTEVSNSTDPKDPTSIPGNLAPLGTAILGTQSAEGVDTPYFNAGAGTSINDQNPATRVDTFNSAGTDPVSFVGITWDALQTQPILRLELSLATFYDGGWFGPNNKSPGAGNKLTPTYLTEPNVQVSADGGVTWTNVGRISDYLTALNGHGIGGGNNPNPSFVTAKFILDPPVSDITGVRIIGSEGGTASGGFLGVAELKVYARTDSDSDGMDDDWERANGLVVGVNDASSDQDSDGLKALDEYLKATNPRVADTDGDGLADGAEVFVHLTNPVSADTDTDGLSDGAEVKTYATDPLRMDTDKDGFPDGLEVLLGSQPNNAASIPANLALRTDAAGILGTMDVPGGIATPWANSGSTLNINDGDLASRVDTYNIPGTDTISYVGVLWTNTVTNAIYQLELDLATFYDGGWFGNNGVGPGASGLLSSNTDLVLPSIEATADGGATWTNVPFTSDYLAQLEGHQLPVVNGAPTRATAHFQLNNALTGINGIRIIGSEGGTASAGFLGVYELAALTKSAQPVTLLGASLASGQFRFEFDTQSGSSYVIQYKDALTDSSWTEQETIPGTGARKVVTYPASSARRFYRVQTQ
jgi:hypothetical protein